MSELTIKGKIIANLGVQKGTSKAGKDWAKASLVVESAGQYPKKVLLDNMRDAENFAKLAVGTEGVFYIEPESHEFNGKWFTNINCWKWEAIGQQQAPQTPQAAQPSEQPKQTETQGDNDLPF